MGLDLISRTLRTSAVILLIFLPFGIYYFGVYPTLAILSGAVWGFVNLIFLAQLVTTVIRPDKIDIRRAVGLGLIKFPLLYGSGYFLLTVKEFDPVHLLIGFSLFLAVIVLKMLGRAILGLDNKDGKTNKNLQGAL
ncbi:MAG: hypothetical protein PHU88_01710 [candidate division Zixibacteria bacterium]|nr:hypothetical protein [candidate division Zixibacteria bacterium]MDD5426928.1 hypothetical protein [candidate division Zixibacteria bacterium]